MTDARLARAKSAAATLRKLADHKSRALNVGNTNPMSKTVDGESFALAELAEIVADLCAPEKEEHVMVSVRGTPFLQRVGSWWRQG